MKTKLILTIAMILLACFSLEAQQSVLEDEVISGASLTDLGDYTIKTAREPISLKGKVLTTYELSYEFANYPVYIGIDPVSEECRNFVVKTQAFTLVYRCENHVFGSCTIASIYNSNGEELDLSIIDKRQKFAQRIITQNIKSEDELLGLIACYFPDLIKESYRKLI
ncbi:hypothetical protein ACUNWD_02980 [Sunxiuqinia sp. A32]|uniref:hypothetical protein n=1 Tax=Sunxiuqinia sp. A32 TaxID=3461496 RepID=UPI004045AAA9